MTRFSVSFSQVFAPGFQRQRAVAAALAAGCLGFREAAAGCGDSGASRWPGLGRGLPWFFSCGSQVRTKHGGLKPEDEIELGMRPKFLQHGEADCI